MVITIKNVNKLRFRILKWLALTELAISDFFLLNIL